MNTDSFGIRSYFSILNRVNTPPMGPQSGLKVLFFLYRQKVLDNYRQKEYARSTGTASTWVGEEKNPVVPNVRDSLNGEVHIFLTILIRPRMTTRSSPSVSVIHNKWLTSLPDTETWSTYFYLSSLHIFYSNLPSFVDLNVINSTPWEERKGRRVFVMRNTRLNQQNVPSVICCDTIFLPCCLTLNGDDNYSLNRYRIFGF